MRIGVISDLHVDLNEEASSQGAVVASLSAASARRGAELLIVAGDIANRYDTSLRTLAALEAASGLRVLFVPGNHDVWNEASTLPFGRGWGAWDSYRALEAFPGNLARGPVDLPGGWSVIGTWAGTTTPSATPASRRRTSTACASGSASGRTR